PGDLLDQVVDRPPPGCRGRPGVRHPRPRHPPPDPAADDQPREPRRGLRLGLRALQGAAGRPRARPHQLLRLRRHQRLGVDEALRGIAMSSTVDDAFAEEDEWLRAAMNNPAFQDLADPAEDLYSPEDGEPFSDSDWPPTVLLPAP